MTARSSGFLPPPTRAARAAGLALGAFVVGTTLVSFSRSPRWPVRIWDFPRLQIAGLGILAKALLAPSVGRSRIDAAALGLVSAALLVQARKIAVYTPLWPVQVQRSEGKQESRDRLRILFMNVQRENSRFERVRETIEREDPDVLLVVEVDDRWERALEPVAERYPHAVRQPQQNHYGMILYSRFPLEEGSIEFLIEEDVPSIRAVLVLPTGKKVRVYALHPRPPQPQRAIGTAQRDAELVVVGRAIARGPAERPTVVVGDLNDVAWSQTTGLFLRLSRLLDPRIGRGFFNSFHARVPFIRFPLDHIFHSSHFRLVRLERLGYVGSDHFPMLAEFSLEPDASSSQEEPEPERGDRATARERLGEQRGEPG